jgi:hypothetical protein
MWQSKREISREYNDIIGSAKGSQIREKYIETDTATSGPVSIDLEKKSALKIKCQ